MNSYLHSFPPALGYFVLMLVGVLMPIWDYFETKRLRSTCTTRDRLRHYWTILVAHFALTAISIWALGGQILRAGGALAVAQNSIGRPWISSSLLGLSIAFVLISVASLIQGLVRPKTRLGYTRIVEKTSFSFMFPRSRSERYTFAALCVSAGICEEIIFRSFFVAYFMSPPFGWSPIIALAVSSLVFGINHGYQGPIGIAKTGVVGFLFGLFYFTTGSLVAAMVLHALIDLTVLYMYRPDLVAAVDETKSAVGAT